MVGMLYRGVHAAHPALLDARQGRAVPGDVLGTVTPDQHNLGGRSQDSPYTSWTHDRRVAETYARSGGAVGGVVLEAPAGAPPMGAQWSWELSPDYWNEKEVLLRGVRNGLGVTNP